MTTPEAHPNYRPPVEMPHLELEYPPSDHPSREELGAGGKSRSSGCRAFRASDILSPSECALLIAAAEESGPGLTCVDWEYTPDYRDCRRAVMRSSVLAAALYGRLMPLLTDDECENVRPFGFDGGGCWRPFKVNDVVRISRYDSGGHFKAHRDGAFVENDDVRSVYTILVYLNQAPAFAGGRTTIYPTSQAGGEDAVAVEPSTGSALVMTHDTLHAGEAVLSGRKYVARFDLMFRRLGGGMTQAELSRLPERRLAERLYSSSIDKQRRGDPGGSTEDYVRALNIQAKMPSCSERPAARQYDDAFRTLGEDCFVLCLRFLGRPADIVNSSAVSRSWRATCSSGVLWRELFALRWPALRPAEETVIPARRDDEGGRSPPPEMPPFSFPSSSTMVRPYGRGSSYRVFAALLPRRPDASGDDGDGRSMLKERLYPKQDVPDGYMFSSLELSDFGTDKRRRHEWKAFHARVQGGSLVLSEVDGKGAEAEADASPRRQRCGGGYNNKRKEKYDSSSRDDARFDAPPSVPLGADADLSFARNSPRAFDACIVKLPGGTTSDGESGQYLAVCKDDPRTNDPSPFWASGAFSGIVDDVARAAVAHQTERALRFGDYSSPAVRCDAKTKQWKYAYAKRHVAERLFDVVTVDVGSKTTKFATDAPIEDILRDRLLWRAGGWVPGQLSSQLPAVCRFFAMAASKYEPGVSLAHINSNGGGARIEFLIEVADKLNAAKLVDRALSDPELARFVPRVLLEAGAGSGSFPSLVQPSRGHLWSAGHGLENHHVGDSRPREGGEGEPSRGPFGHGDDRVPDCDIVGIICAYVVEATFARKPRRTTGVYHTTIAEHPINVVEPALGFSESVRMRLMRKLSSWNVPFVGFVNGAAAALLCGDEPRQDGIVVMLGGANSAAVRVEDGMAQISAGVRLFGSHEEDVAVITGEVCDAIRQLQTGDEQASLPILMTGGGATDEVVNMVKAHIHTGVYVASPERGRHLDAVRGGNIMANLSDGRKHFRGVLNLMWTIQVGNGRD
uniref:Fe2OG dioxygenase domain-containing protein n=1 Tax=Odontella aurita TaxID=265563 RepID=A0A6U6L6I9_9STRA